MRWPENALGAISRYGLVVVVALALSTAPPQHTGTVGANPGGCYREVGGIRLLCLHGGSYEMGLQQGSLLADAIRGLVEAYLYQHLVHDLGVSQPLLAAYARVIDASVPAELRWEMRGIADGAGLAYQDVLLLNIIPDVLALARRLPLLELSPAVLLAAGRDAELEQSIVYPTRAEQGLSCASYAVWGEVTVDGGLLAGHRLERSGDDLLNDNLLVTVRRPARGNASVSAGLVGTVGVWAGISEERIITSLSSSPSVDVAAAGPPLPFVLRQVLEGAGDMDQGLQLLLSSGRLCGGNVLIGDARVPEAAAVELSAHRHAVFELAGSAQVLARTNHFLDNGLAVAQDGLLSAAERAESVARLSRLNELLTWNAGWIGTGKALQILKDDPGVLSETSADALGTPETEPPVAQMVLFDPQEGAMWILQGGSEVWLALADLLNPASCCALP